MAIDSESFLDQNPPNADLLVQYQAGPVKFAEVRVPASGKPWPVVMNIHGGFWRAKYDLSHTGHFCAALARAGLATFNVEYSRVGDPGGGWLGTLDDVRSAYQYLFQNAEELGFDSARIAVAGHSAGGQLALCLAAYEDRVANVVSLAGVLDLQQAYELHLSNNAVVDFLGGPPDEVPGHYREASPSNLEIRARQVVITGTEDDVVPAEISRGYAQRKASAGEKVKLVEIPGADHYDLIDPRTKAFETTLESIRRLLN
jgi:acetyl esterase/lipase